MSQGSNLPGSLNCSDIANVRRGATWNELTIGVSSAEDVLRQLAPAEPEWNTTLGSLSYIGPPRDIGWGEVHACFNGNTLSALNVLGGLDLLRTRNVPTVGSVELWVAEFGNPDRVTWSFDYFYRTLIWAENGILATVGSGTGRLLDRDRTATVNYILFPPIKRSELEDSWLTASLPSEMPPFTGDVAPMPPDLEVEDPWDLER